MRVPKGHWLYTTPIAHRGLWGCSIVENSLSAYRNAVKHGYAIEIDVYTTSDGEVVSFHDVTLDRMTGADGLVFEKTLAELKELTLVGSNEKIPTLKEVLQVVDGKVPLLIEIKMQPNINVVDKTIEILKEYKGEFAIQSFHPGYLIRVKKLAPEFLRGVLSAKKVWHKNVFKRFLVREMIFNPVIKPDFISYDYNGLPLSKRKRKNLPLLVFTVTDENVAEIVKSYADNIIFEHIRPEINA